MIDDAKPYDKHFDELLKFFARPNKRSEMALAQ
jgi:hypothetical protein